MINAESVVAVVVTYHPDLDALSALFERLRPQVASIVAVDNGSGPFLPEFLATRAGAGIHVISLPGNTGVANAVNVGMQWARQAGATMVVTFDQDSLPAPDMVACLLAAYAQLQQDGVRVGALGPLQIDRRSQLPTPFVAAAEKGWKRVLPVVGEVLEVDHLITSGCLFPLAVIEQIGPMLAELFIDGVDLEWSWRCRAAGFRLYGIERASLLHAIGDRIVSFCGRQLHLHGPLRQYYILRNTLYLRTLDHSPAAWRRVCWRGLLMRLVFFSLFASPRFEYCRLMLLGVKHGLTGRLGPAASGVK
ncbi:glycosyltransferase family 2 protein [Azonexus sp.]|uniref:glycosyltransferase family 2 protein n=1 Tax=Azonexus sp. TaxID=1872668 RepID=UPI0027BA92BA|nr:glycosyltransferase family 2 protein [Azonexus sp.]